LEGSDARLKFKPACPAFSANGLVALVLLSQIAADEKGSSLKASLGIGQRAAPGPGWVRNWTYRGAKIKDTGEKVFIGGTSKKEFVRE
jgi:hypothetical protein